MPVAVLRALDERLFLAAEWFAIDAANRRVPGVAPGSLDQALGLVGHGRVASVVGRLRPEVCGVDVDLVGELGLVAVDTITSWCTERGLWHLVRASGGDRGRAHVLLVPGVHRAAFAAFIGTLRAELGASPRLLDVREQLRPLSAPHRRRGPTPPPVEAAAALGALGAVLDVLPDRVTARRDRIRPLAPVTEIAGPREPLVPAARRRRDLPAPWAAYLERGRRAARVVDRDPSTRSQIELEATTQLVICGYTEAEAWGAITAAHPTAFSKARSRGRRWWWHTWNRCVIDADTWLAQGRAASVPPAGQDATVRLRAHLEEAWLTWPASTRHTDYEVAAVLVDLMDRHGSTAVPIAQRELLLACAVASRTTLRASLARLVAQGLFEVEQTYVKGTVDTSHTYRVAERFTKPERVAQGGVVRATDPHRFQPPLAAPLPHLALRQSLGLRTAQLLMHLPAADSGRGLDAVRAGRAGGLVADVRGEASASELRAVRACLRVLSEYGLARVDSEGLWQSTSSAAGMAGARRAMLETAGQGMTARKVAMVAAERAGFRAVVDPEVRARRWARQRDAALARGAKAASVRQSRWWEAMSVGERVGRRAVWEARFAALSPSEQALRKQALAMRRSRTGLVEQDRYLGWLASLSARELEARRVARAVAYAARDRIEQIELASSWSEHRARWNLRPKDVAAARAGVGLRPPLPEESLLCRDSDDVDEAALFELASTGRVRQRAG